MEPENGLINASRIRKWWQKTEKNGVERMALAAKNRFGKPILKNVNKGSGSVKHAEHRFRNTSKNAAL
jgi:hypothetical protein